MKDKGIIRNVGIFLSTIFFLLSLNYILMENTGRGDTVLARFFYDGLMIFFVALLIFSAVKVSKFSCYIHICVVLAAGLLTVFDNFEPHVVHGEMIVIIGLLVARTYGIAEKHFKKLFWSLLLLCIAVKFLSGIVNENLIPSDYISYLVLLLFLNFFFFIVLTSAEEKQKTEARRICNHWQKEQVYIDIGKNVFSSFVHDYNISDSFMAMESVRRHIKSGNKERADKMAVTVMEMLLEDEKRINSVRSRVIMSNKVKPETVEVLGFIYTLFKRLKLSRSLGYRSVEIINNTTNLCNLLIVPIDFSGIIENITKNALEATKNQSEREISLIIEEKANSIVLWFNNNGPKIPWAKKSGVVDPSSFRPGNTTKEEGTGWGMYATIHRIEDNKGTIQITSTDEETTFRVEFPLFHQNKGDAHDRR